MAPGNEVPLSKFEIIRARVEPDLKAQAEAGFGAIGLTRTEAITRFYRQVTLHHGLPFPVRLPDASTEAAIRDAVQGRPGPSGLIATP